MNRINILTLGVTNMERSIKFYKDGLGFKSRNTDYNRYPTPIIFFNTDGGIIFALTPINELEKVKGDTSKRKSETFGGFTIAYNCKTKDEVDEVIAKAKTAGAVITAEPTTGDWGGYWGHFFDPDGYYWEINYDPVSKFDDNGNLLDYE